MLENVIDDVVGAFSNVFMVGDWMTVAIAVGAVVIAAFMTQRAGQAFQMALLGLVFYAAANYIRDALTRPASPEGGSPWVDSAQANWDAFMDLRLASFIAYFLVFYILILILHFVMGMLFRRG